MWLCKQCGYKNNNSTKNCHGEMCKGVRIEDANELPTIVLKEEKALEESVYDWCSVCGKDQYFSKTKRVGLKMRYKCHGCHKPFVKIGKNKVKPSEIFRCF